MRARWRRRALLSARRLARRLACDPLDAALALAVVSTALYVIVVPLAVVRYPPMTDLPFHAAQTSALLHYADPSFHFREQFTLHPIAVPYLSMYAIGAVLMIVLPPLAATKIAAAVMLALLPAGLAVLFHGMKRSPLLGVLGLGVVWCNLTHWGFLNFMGALGLFGMAVGQTLLLVDRPSRWRQIALSLTLVALFFTHIFRFPFALCAVVGTAVLVYPETRRLRPIVLPLLPPLALLAIWLRVRPSTLRADFEPMALHWERLQEIPNLFFTSFTDPAEQLAAQRAGHMLLAALALAVIARIVERRFSGPLHWPRADSGGSSGRSPRASLAFAAGAAGAPLACATVFLGLFLVLPMQIGLWWYVYPREATAALFLALGAFPDLPCSPWIRAPIVLSLCAAAIGMGAVVANNYKRFDAATEDFYAITRGLPEAPKLLYLIFDHRGSTRTTTPFIHLPAWVQAERGGWLSFHFAVWNASPLVYRGQGEPGAVVPPQVPLRWEWTPQKFDVKRHGAFFDWFLVRDARAPDRLFAADPSLQRVDHIGSWWLYHRSPTP